MFFLNVYYYNHRSITVITHDLLKMLKNDTILMSRKCKTLLKFLSEKSEEEGHSLYPEQESKLLVFSDIA